MLFMQATIESRKVRIKTFIDNLNDERLLLSLEAWLFGEGVRDISEEELALLDERIAEHQANPDASIPWQEFVQQIRIALRPFPNAMPALPF